MYTNTQNINTNELVVVHYGNTATIKGSQIIINGQPGPELPYRINDLLVRQATTVLVGIEGKKSFFKLILIIIFIGLIKVRIFQFISMVFVYILHWDHHLLIKHVVYVVHLIL
jgi:hypothetical protein